MRLRLVPSIVLSVVVLAACTVTSTEGPNNPSGPGNDPPAGSDGGTSGSDAGQGGDSSTTEKPPASTTPVTVDIDGTCPAFTPCGGNPQGTYDYVGGCVEDVFAEVRNECPGLDSSGASVTGKGSIYFIGNTLHRNVSTTISGTIVLPAACAAGQCALVAAQLTPLFGSVSCTGTASCSCTINHTVTTDDVTTYSISGNVAVTQDGATYEICENGSDLEYKGAGPGSEEGTYQLKKR